MPDTSARKLVAGNWKMNGLSSSLEELRRMVDETKRGAIKADLLICPPATLIQSFVKASAGSALLIGAQDCHVNSSGAHTGNISAEMIADLGATHIIVGHSERRTDHAESDELVRAKAKAVARAGLAAIICVGETEAERDAGRALDVVTTQIEGSIPEDADATRLVIAYEPVWAIGTGRTPSIDDVRQVHAAIRAALVTRFGDAAHAIRILYGGSVKPSNAAELLHVDNVDGALVGGASLKADDFLAIAEAA
ncbi:MAG: triose-phosphate isomerase [Beijerinckiaceae bacterium]|nr:triose-phosphate isomerase [Beijerinckiaceae bacterium]